MCPRATNYAEETAYIYTRAAAIMSVSLARCISFSLPVSPSVVFESALDMQYSA